MIYDLSILGLDSQILLSHLLLELRDMFLKLINLAMEVIQVFIIVSFDFIDLHLGSLLLFPPGLVNCPSALVIEFLGQLGFLLISLLFKRIFAIQLLLEKLVVLLVVLLDMRCNLDFVSLFQLFNGFIIVFEFEQLLFELVAALIELALDFLHADLHLLGLGPVLLLEMRLLLLHGLLVDLELPLAFLSFLDVLAFESLDFVSQLIVFLGFQDLILLFHYDFIRLH